MGLQFKHMELRAGPLFMDIPSYVTHYITPSSPLYNLSKERMVQEFGEVVIEVEGFDPITSGGVKKRFSYVAEEIFVGHAFYDVLSLDNHGCYIVNVGDFHRTKP